MRTVPSSPLVAVLALGVACFTAGFSMTATAYAHLSSTDQPERSAEERGAPEPRSSRAGRHCASP